MPRPIDSQNLTEPQRIMLEYAKRDHGTLVGGGGPAYLARRLSEAGLLRTDDQIEYHITPAGEAALEVQAGAQQA